ncbi:MAG: Rid family hydrolase [Streptosporangiaceae bacterium]
MEIVVTGSMPFNAEHIRRLQRVGRLSQASSADSSDEWLKQVEGADIICSDGIFVAGNLERLHDVFITFPFVEIGSFDTAALARRNVVVANARGSNRDSVVEWAVFMTLSLLRRFQDYMNTDRELPFERRESLSGKNVCIIGAGDIGSHLGQVLEALHANVRYFTREDDLVTAVKGCQLIVNSLSSTPSSAQLLDRGFFRALEPGSYFLTYVRPHTFDVKALLEALDDGILTGAAIDCDPQKPFDTANAYYRTLLGHQKVLATPHVAFATTQAEKQSLDTVVENVEAFAEGRPINVLVKRLSSFASHPGREPMSKQVSSTDPSAPLAPYSQAVVSSGHVFCSGTLGINPTTGKAPETVAAQAEQALMNLADILLESGSSMRQLVKTTIYYVDTEDFAAINEVYARHVSDPPPARSAVPCTVLPEGLLFCIDAIAAVG